MRVPSFRAAGGKVPPTYRLELFRVGAGVSIFVRTLSPVLLGCLTHWIAGQSEYCRGDGLCRHDWHKTKQFWKGFIAAEIYDQGGDLWLPTVLEITERCEQDMRLAYRRGQVWRLSKEKGDKKHKMPLTAKLLEEINPETIPVAFDMRPVLLSIFHVPEIEIDVPNPLPPLVMVKPTPANRAGATISVEGGSEPTPERLPRMVDLAKTGRQQSNGKAPKDNV